MGYKTVRFLGNENTIPEDIFVYMDLVRLTDNAKRQLMKTFADKLRYEIQQGHTGYLGDEALAEEIQHQTSTFIAKLCDNGIFNRTINDYLRNNKGYQMISEVNKSAFEKMKSLVIEEAKSWQEGFEKALDKKESHVTGLNFSILSNSFVNHAIYAAMEASKVSQQEKEAVAQYRKDIDEVEARIDSRFSGEKSNYINKVYIPSMEIAVTIFACELMDKYVADLIEYKKFDPKTLAYVDLSRSNDLLKNLALSGNKKEILQVAFAACPYNNAVYMEALKHDLLDYESFETAKIFRKDYHILSFLKKNWGSVSFPSEFKIDYHWVTVWATATNRSQTEILRELTDRYATCVVNAYSKIADMLRDKEIFQRSIEASRESAILFGDSISRGKAHQYVEVIVSEAIWNELIEKCGHGDLMDRIKKYYPSTEAIYTKTSLDEYIEECLYFAFESARKMRVERIEQREREIKEAAENKERVKRLQEEENKRIRKLQEEEDIKVRKRKRQQREKLKKDILKLFCGILAVVMVVYAAIKVIKPKVIIPKIQYEEAVELMQNGKFEEAREIFFSLGDYGDSAIFLQQCEIEILDITYESIKQLMADGKYKEAYEWFSVSDYKDSAQLAIECRTFVDEQNYKQAVMLMEEGNYAESLCFLKMLDGQYKDCEQRIRTCKAKMEDLYLVALSLIEDQRYDEAYKCIDALGEFKDCKAMLEKFKFVCDEKIHRDRKGFIEQIYTYKYDAAGNVVEERSDKGDVVSYVYGEHGELIEKVMYLNSGERVRTNYLYENDLLVQLDESDSYNNQKMINYFYDSNGYLVKEDVYTNGKKAYDIVYDNDEEGRLVAVYDRSSVKEYEYTVDGRVFRCIHTEYLLGGGSDDGRKTIYEYEYDTNGNCTKVTEKWSTKERNTVKMRVNITEYVYDENNCLISEREYHDGIVVDFIEYGEYGLVYTGERTNK